MSNQNKNEGLYQSGEVSSHPKEIWLEVPSYPIDTDTKMHSGWATRRFERSDGVSVVRYVLPTLSSDTKELEGLSEGLYSEMLKAIGSSFDKDWQEYDVEKAAQACASIATRHAANLGDEVERLKEQVRILETVLSRQDSVTATLREACKVVVDGYEGDGMENMRFRDEMFYKSCKTALTSLSKTPE